MKLTVLFILMSVFNISASVYSQGFKATMNVKETSVKDVLGEIEKKSQFKFLYRNDIVDVQRKVSFNSDNEDLDAILGKLFDLADITFRIFDDNIVVITSGKNELQITVSGSVKDAKSGTGLPGVNIKVQGTSEGTITDLEGNFTLKVGNPSATLTFSFIGYVPQTVALDGKTKLDILLVEETKNLDEVVVVGYGSSRKKDVTGALSVVSSKEFVGRANASLGTAIEGKIAGVQISKPSGQPQAGFNIRIRGTSTITAGSEPLYIVDVVPTTSINEISPTDIETMTILKDASSAAIYGASGSNGVVLITTKRGGNQATKVTFNMYSGVANVWKKQDVLNATEYKALMTDMNQTMDWSLYTYDNNWQDKAFRTANSKSYQMGITGGNDKTNYYISGSYLRQEGIVISNNMERYTFKVNLDHKISDIFKVGTSISYNKWKDVDVNENRKYGSVLAVLTGAPVTDVYNTDGTFAINPFIQDLENPVALLLKNEHNYQNYRFNGNVYGEANILKNLKFRSMFGFEQLNSTYSSWVDPIRSREGRGFKGMADLSNTQNTYWITENTITYNLEANQHSVNILAGFVASNKNYSYASISARGFGSPAVHTVNAGSIKTASADASQRRNAAFLGRLNYGFDDRYLLTANFRADASSVFGANNKWGYFPSFSGGWRVSKESFFKGFDMVNDLKVRAGWGIVGNDQVGDFSSFGLVTPGSFYVFGGSVVPGTSLSSLENSDLKWETTKQTNFGIDVAFLDDRISLSTDYYIKKTSDMLLNCPIPASVGISGSTATKNVGSMENKGIEFQISSKNLVNELKWNTDFNISFNKSKTTKLDKGVPIKLGFISDRGNVAIAQEGQPLGMFYGYVSEGVDPATGDLKFSDLDKSGTLSDGDQVIIGNSNPKYTFGITNSFSYHNFTFSFFIQSVQGNDIFNATRIETEGLFDEANQLKTVLNRWTKVGQVTDMPRADYGKNHNSLISSRYIEDGSFTRLKSATLGYEVPQSIAKKLKMSRLYIYITGENLLTFTKYSGFDPEVSVYGRSSDNGQKNIAPGVDYGTYPQTRDFLFGINLTF